MLVIQKMPTSFSRIESMYMEKIERGRDKNFILLGFCSIVFIYTIYRDYYIHCILHGQFPLLSFRWPVFDRVITSEQMTIRMTFVLFFFTRPQIGVQRCFLLPFSPASCPVSCLLHRCSHQEQIHTKTPGGGAAMC